jgi:hypothetical protein
MINLNVTPRIFIHRAATVAILAMVSMGAWAQDTTTTTIRHGEKSYDTEVRNAEVVYVEGNDLVLKLENGKVEHLVVPDSDKFRISGQDVSVHELTAGTKLTQKITTATAPRYVTTVRTLKGRVWHVSAPHSVIVALPDHTHKTFEVPKNAKFTVNGKEMTVFDLKKGMTFEATVVTDDSETVVERNKASSGFAATPTVLPEVGVLLIQWPTPTVTDQPITVASAEPLPEALPRTGTVLPLVGLLGTLFLAGSFGLKAVRKKITG